MKSIIILLAVLSTALLSSYAASAAYDNQITNASETVRGDTIKIMASPELMNLTKDWQEEYSRIHAGVPFIVNSFDPAGIITENTIFFLTGGKMTYPDGKPGWEIMIGHNAVVPFINEDNPLKAQILASGITSEEIASLLTSASGTSWSDILDGSRDLPAVCFLPENLPVINALSRYISKDNGSISAEVLADATSVITAVRKYPGAIGFCRLSDLVSDENGELPAKIILLPLDKNSNGRIDSFENIYNTKSELVRGIWIGKYPKDLCGSIVAASSVKPRGENVTEFLRWITLSGGDFLAMNGFSDLASIEKSLNLASLGVIEEQPAMTENKRGWGWIIPVSLLVAAGFILTISFRSGRTKKAGTPVSAITSSPVFTEKNIVSPAGLWFDKTHTWAFMEKDGMVRIGVDDFMQHVTGTITRVVMREPGEFVRRGEKIVTIIRDGKQLSLYAPVSGKILSQNTDLYIDPSILNYFPYSDGWIYLIEPGNWAREIQFMFMEGKFREWLKDEFIRLRDFFANSAKMSSPELAYAVMQDGGELRDNILSGLDPEVWEDFQTNFLNISK